LTEIWCELFNVERVGLSQGIWAWQNFQQANRVSTRGERCVAVELPLRVLFEAQSVSQCAERIDTVPRLTQQNEPAGARVGAG
jgi:hypothetical protein